MWPHSPGEDIKQIIMADDRHVSHAAVSMVAVSSRLPPHTINYPHNHALEIPGKLNNALLI